MEINFTCIASPGASPGASSMCANSRAANFCNRREIQIDELELYAIGAHIVPNAENRERGTVPI